MTDADANDAGRWEVAGEPARDAELGARLRELLGDAPAESVDWIALSARIARAASAVETSWWSYVARWNRTLVPVALAAGIAGAVALWRAPAPPAAEPARGPDMVTAVIGGTPSTDAARTFAQSLVSVATVATVASEPEE